MMTVEQGMESLVAEGTGEDTEKQVSRRQFLTGAVVGGAAGLAVAAGTGVAVWKVDDAQTPATLDEANAEIERLQGLVDLYDGLEKVGLDAILASGMAAVALPVEAVEAGAKALKTGLEKIEEALLALEEALPTAAQSIEWLETRISAVSESITKLEESVGNALEKASDTRVGQALADLSSMVLDNLPFGLGGKIRDVLDEIVVLVTSADELVEGINSNFLEPLHEKWFSSEEGQGIGASLVNPLVENVLDPLEGHLGELAVLADTWQESGAASSEQEPVRELIINAMEAV
jgi:hypothetical protein